MPGDIVVDAERNVIFGAWALGGSSLRLIKDGISYTLPNGDG
jgi:hypothetical protein